MKKGDKIKAQELWNLLSIREETEDQWGRKGRGIDLVYFNQKYKDLEFILN